MPLILTGFCFQITLLAQYPQLIPCLTSLSCSILDFGVQSQICRWLGKNHLNGTIPSEFNNVYLNTLYVFNIIPLLLTFSSVLDDNQLTGSIPSTISVLNLNSL